MCFIWINPVVGQMYDKKILDSLLNRHGYTRIECRQDWAGHVYDEYKKLTEQSGYPIADVRCPAVSRLLKEKYRARDLLIPDIEPILIHCARELSKREDLKGRKKLIITPCRILAHMGNEAAILDTHFLSWNQFLKNIGERPEAGKLESSPIPPGFFNDFDCPVASITGETEVRAFLDSGCYKEVRMIEFLWCKDGCHHGDGVIGLE